jgi:hypothetical protein
MVAQKDGARKPEGCQGLESLVGQKEREGFFCFFLKKG